MATYPRKLTEKYGKSTVELVELNMSDNPYENLNVDGKNVVLPVLNLKKYDSNSHCYALIERLEERSITMIDLIYSYNSINFDDKNYREKFLETFTRDHMNLVSMKGSGIFIIPEEAKEKEKFVKALGSSIQDSVGQKVIMAEAEQKEKFDLESEKKESSKITPYEIRGIIHQMLGGTSKGGGPEKVKVKLSKMAIFIKSGELIVNNNHVSRYFTLFKTNFGKDPKKPKNLKDVSEMLSICLTGVDDTLLTTSPEYSKDFGETVLQSYILETALYLNKKKLPKFEYLGQYDNDSKVMKVDTKVEGVIDKINDVMATPSQNQDFDGR